MSSAERYITVDINRVVKTMVSAYKMAKRVKCLSKVYNSPLKIANLMIFCVYLVAHNTANQKGG